MKVETINAIQAAPKQERKVKTTNAVPAEPKQSLGKTCVSISEYWYQRQMKGGHSKKTLDALCALIEECENAIRRNPDTKAGMTWIEQSKFIQGLLYDWLRATTFRAPEPKAEIPYRQLDGEW